ncbi:MAG: RNA methyltransferase [Clostridia bacterium]|nr:RNA methyltransferase [Clostridia bacterium]
MARVIEITSLDAPELDVYVRLTQAQLRVRKEAEQGIFIAEGLKVIGHALDAGLKPLSFLMERRHIEGKAAGTLARCGDVPVYTAESAVLEKLTGFALTRGVLCAMERPSPRSAEEICRGMRRIAVLENLVDPSNVGAIFRNAAALGMDAVLLAPSCCDPLGRRSVRVSMGTVFQIPWAVMPMTAAEWLERGTEQLRQWGFRTAAMALDERAVSIEHPAVRGEARLAVLLGAEGDGLQRQTIAGCDYTVMIPMSHGVDSLNVAAASAVAFWTLAR